MYWITGAGEQVHSDSFPYQSAYAINNFGYIQPPPPFELFMKLEVSHSCTVFRAAALCVQIAVNIEVPKLKHPTHRHPLIQAKLLVS
jgi:hypothetical protein